MLHSTVHSSRNPASSSAASSSSYPPHSLLHTSSPSSLPRPSIYPLHPARLAKERPLLAGSSPSHRPATKSPSLPKLPSAESSLVSPLDHLGRPPLLKLHSTAYPSETSPLHQRPPLVSTVRHAAKTCEHLAETQPKTNSRNGNGDQNEETACCHARIAHRYKNYTDQHIYSCPEHPPSPITVSPTESPLVFESVLHRAVSMSSLSMHTCKSSPSSPLANETSERLLARRASLGDAPPQPTARSRRKPAPIATKLPAGGSTRSKPDAAADEDHDRNSTDSEASTNGRDSGIALESWDIPPSQLITTSSECQQHDTHTSELPAWKQKRRQRCQSMVCPRTATTLEDVSPLVQSDMCPQADVLKTHGKRGASVSLGSSHHGASYSLPPQSPHSIPPLSKAKSRSSFFVSPLLHDDSIDADSSSSRPRPGGIVPASMQLPRTPSPPLSSTSRFSRGIPFSDMMDLATAKAENITGLYYARQMKRTSAPQLSNSDPTTTAHICSADLHPPHSTPCEHLSLSHEESAEIRIEINAASPVSNRQSHPRSGESTTIGAHGECQNTPSVSWAHSSSSPDTRVEFSTDTRPSKASSVPPRGQHRRSHSASHFFHLSSLKHHSPAQFNLALCYEHGKGGVDKDLEKAVHFYQQAADQGHTKASYNIGCICYNHGEVSKAISWFESAGRCSVRGLRKEFADPAQTGCSRSSPSLPLPLPKQTTLTHELESMLLGDLATTSGPFAAYLPAILCLALLCRQGVQNRNRETILKRDHDQSVKLLESLLQEASQRTRQEGAHDQCTPEQPGSSSRLHDSNDGNKQPGFTKSDSSDPLKLSGHMPTSSLFSSSCPSLPMGNDHSDTSSNAPYYSQSSPSLQPPLGKMKRSVTVEEMDEKTHESSQMQDHPREWPGADDQEAWSVTLARRLLKAWKPTNVTRAQAPGTELSPEAEKRNRTILRHHLLYITNPTLGKNLYNLGVLYDLHMRDAEIAIKCYRSAYQNSWDVPPSDPHQHPSQVTRINSAWNLGVLHVRRKEWRLAQEWFLRAQHDIVSRECQQQLDLQQRAHVENVHPQPSLQGNTLPHKKSMVNMIPERKATLPTDSPGRIHAREYGLVMHLDAIASVPSRSESCSSFNVAQAMKASPVAAGGSEELLGDGIRTDASKVSWVLRWVEFQMIA